MRRKSRCRFFRIWSSSPSKRLCTLQTTSFTKQTPIHIVFCNLLRKRNVFCMYHHICNPMLNHQWSDSLWKKQLQITQSKTSVFPGCTYADIFCPFPVYPVVCSLQVLHNYTRICFSFWEVFAPCFFTLYISDIFLQLFFKPLPYFVSTSFTYHKRSW